MKLKINNKKDKKRTLEVVALIIAIISLTLGFLAFSNQLRIQSVLAVNNDVLTFKVVFSSDDIKIATDAIKPIISGGNVTGQDAIINNTYNPVITNLGANFTGPGQKVKYKFFVYNAGEYTAYLNNITYKNIGKSTASKLCITNEGQTTGSVKEACDNIRITVHIDDIITTQTLLNINNKFLRPRTAQPIEITIEYLDDVQYPTDTFDVLFGDIELNYSNTLSKN